VHRTNAGGLVEPQAMAASGKPSLRY